MERVALILLIFIALLDGRHPELIGKAPPGWHVSRVDAAPLPLDTDAPLRRALGELHYRGGWALTSPSPAFGGISSLAVDDGGHVTALSDGGIVLRFRAGQARGRLLYRQLPIAAWEVGKRRALWDTESMTLDRASGKVWVGFEVDGHICRYDDRFVRLENCVWPEASAAWPGKTSMESLARLPDGRFLAIAEDSPGPKGFGHDVLLFPGDPADPETAPPVRMSYIAPPGYLPTDAVAVGRDRLLVLNRRLTLMNLFTGVLVLVDIHDLSPGAVLRGREVARLAPPVQHDNFEALAVSREGGERVLWVASDDNHLFFQRSLLLKFAMPEAWFDPVGGR